MTLGDRDGAEEFTETYLRYRDSVLIPTEQRLKGIFHEWRTPNYWASYGRFEDAAIPAPTQRTRTRIKRIESVLDKFRRMPNEFPGPPDLDNLRRLRDALGARVITYFPSHLAMVDKEIRNGRHFELSKDKPPKSYLPREMLDRLGVDPQAFRGDSVKPSGYASLHYTVRLLDPVEEENPWFELQTRTMLEEVWGEVEHQIGYKPDQRTSFSVKRQFRVISDHLQALDSHFDFLYSELAFQQANSNPIDQDQLNAENLPSVLRDMECLVLQKEIDGLLRILDDYGVNTVGGLKDLGRLDIVDAIKGEYGLSTPDREPTAFDVIPVLLQLDRQASTDEARRLLRLHIQMARQSRR